MIRPLKSITTAVMLLVTTLVITGCEGEFDDLFGEWSRPTGNVNSGNEKPSGNISVTSIMLNETTLTKKLGDVAVTLTATVKPDNATDKTITWTSENPAVASVNNGLVSIIGVGTAIITAAANDGSGVKATCTVTVSVPGLLAGKFSVSATKQVRFSQGNLQAKIAGYASNVATASEWRFADSQYSYIGNAAGNTSFAVDTWVDLFSWVGESANNDTYGLITFTSSTQVNHGNNTSESLKSDWGKLAISNGGNAANSGWRTLTSAEWTYLFQTRTDAANKFGYATVAGKNGIIIVPDEFTDPMKNGGSNAFVGSTTTGFNANVYTEDNWTAMEAAGCVFLPAAGTRLENMVYNSEFYDNNGSGRYWSSNSHNDGCFEAFCIGFYADNLCANYDSENRCSGISVRLVCPVP